MKKSILFFTFLLIFSFAYSQVIIIYYELEFNEATDLFDCKMYIEDGIAMSPAERLQLDAQYSIVVETGTTVSIAENFLPIYNNETYTGTVPMNWSIDNVQVNPAEMPGFDIIRIVPDIGGQPAHYNDLSCCNTITLFSLSATGNDICGLSLRILDNNEDPTDIGGVDFSNNMMIGLSEDIYYGNKLDPDIWQDIDITLTEGSVCMGECITLEATFNCVFPGLTFEWSTGETTESITVCPDFSDEYILFLNGPNGFSGETTTFITVNPEINTFGVTDLCVGVPVDYIPNSGEWSSSNTSVATVSNTGVVTPIASGTATITNTSSTGTCSDQVVITVTDPEPPTIIGKNEICVGDVTQLSPSTGVLWESSNNAIATVDNFGNVTGTGLGEAVFTYTTELGQCVSDPTPIVTVLQIPVPWITGPDTLCVGEMTTLTPSAGVIWESTDPSVATIDNSGNVTSVSEGSTTFYFTDLATDCTSGESGSLTVLPSPVVQLSADTVCQGENVLVTTNFDGGTLIRTVISGDPDIVFINQTTGSIATLKPGVISVQYINAEGCISDDSTVLTILPKPYAIPTSNSPICRGENLLLSATVPPGTNYSYQWTGSNGFTSDQMNVTIPSDDLNQIEVYFLTASENGCDGENFAVDVFVEDCDPCDEGDTMDGWIKVQVSDEDIAAIDDYEIGSSLITGRELEDFVYYNSAHQDVRLVKNTGNENFEEEVVLFDLPPYGDDVTIDIVDFDQDGLNDIITYQWKYPTSSSADTLLFTIFNNKDNYSFESTLSVVEDSWYLFIGDPVNYIDLDGQGYLDIIPSFGSIFFTEDWEENSFEHSELALSVLIEDFNEDGYLDVLRNNKTVLTNNGDRTFDLNMIEGAHITDPGYYDFENQVFINPFTVYQISTGEDPFIDGCTDLFEEGSNCFFTANINSSSVENGINRLSNGFNIFELPMSCDNVTIYESNFQFRPNKDGIIDLTGNGYTDFITVEDGTIFAWINPNEQPKLRGTAFIDNNGDGILNENDSPLRNVLISIEPGELSVLTDDYGEYQLAVPEGTYTLTAKVNEGEWITDELVIDNIDIEEPCNLGFDFGFVPDLTSMSSVNLSMVNTIARCDFETRFTITVENTGTEPLLSILQFEFDDKTTLFDVEFSGSTTIGNKVVANIGPLLPFQPQEYRITVKMPGGSAVLPMLDFNASLVNLIGETIAEYGYTEQLRCSYDPNDKRTFPDRVGDENLTLMDEDIEYTIRFQNNGNDTAYNVKIVDPLDGNIEPSSIRLVGSSHEVETCIEGSDLIFLFEDIYLVDSATNYVASQGYVTFKCNAKEGRAEFTEVNNSADIIFDTNPPITTNQTINTLVSVLCTDKSTIIDEYICDGESYMGHTESGTYTESYGLPYGCDSVVTINLTVQGITYSQQDFDVCGETSITIGSEEYFIENSTTIIDTVINDQGCISSILKFEITVVPDFFEIDEMGLCINEIGFVPSILEGSWTVDDESVIVLNQQGIITAVNPGMATLQYLDNETGCMDEIQVEVFDEPMIFNGGSNQLCVNETIILSADSDGSWSSSDPDVATISTDGLVEGMDAGTATITFTNMTTGCSTSTDLLILDLTDSNCLVSTNELADESVSIYPNPASGYLFIESKENWRTAKLINVQGQFIKEVGQFEMKKKIDLGDISSGLYFVVLERESGMVVKRFVVD